jgi:glycosyltransferase involved in cell wall biosynthesis
MACGTPVIAHDRGSMGEIVDDGTTGYLVANVMEASVAVEGAGHLDRATIRQRARERFDHRVMADRYAALYRQVDAGRVGS